MGGTVSAAQPKAQQGATISEREHALGVGPMPRTLDIREFSDNARPFYQTYLGDRRKLMAEYTKALYAPNKADAQAALGKLRTLDSFYAKATDQAVQRRAGLNCVPTKDHCECLPAAPKRFALSGLSPEVRAALGPSVIAYQNDAAALRCEYQQAVRKVQREPTDANRKAVVDVVRRIAACNTAFAEKYDALAPDNAPDLAQLPRY
jgi:hypothetical protein